MVLRQEFWDFVNVNATADTAKLRLKYHGKAAGDFDTKLAITQIECRQKFGKKLSETLVASPQWIFPNVLSGEQSTSDRLARYHADFISKYKPTSIVDLTGGLGIDSRHLAGVADSTTVVEIDRAKADALVHNIGAKGVEVVCGDCREYVSGYKGKRYDYAIIDPARRGANGSRIFSIADCQPDVTELLTPLTRIASRLLVKMSPMLDVSQTIKLLRGTERIIALGTRTECKELVADIRLGADEVTSCVIEAVALIGDADAKSIVYTVEEEESATATYAMPKAGEWICEPYPVVMKTAPFKLLSSRYGADKLHQNTHLYLTDERNDAFPGFCYKILEVLPYSSSVIKRLAKSYPRASVATRNFGLTADALRRRLKVQEGPCIRIYGVTCTDGKEYLIVCEA